MSQIREYVGCKSIEAVNYDGKGNTLCNMWVTDEEIVRCRDCAWFHENATLEDRDYPHFCHQHGIDLEDGNGFCKWGERND